MATTYKVHRPDGKTETRIGPDNPDDLTHTGEDSTRIALANQILKDYEAVSFQKFCSLDRDARSWGALACLINEQDPRLNSSKLSVLHKGAADKLQSQADLVKETLSLMQLHAPQTPSSPPKTRGFILNPKTGIPTIGPQWRVLHKNFSRPQPGTITANFFDDPNSNITRIRPNPIPPSRRIEHHSR